jgi:hypothetical protein
MRQKETHDFNYPGALAPDGPWRQATALPVIRGTHPCPPADLEPGVTFFVLMLEQLSCHTRLQ